MFFLKILYIKNKRANRVVRLALFDLFLVRIRMVNRLIVLLSPLSFDPQQQMGWRSQMG